MKKILRISSLSISLLSLLVFSPLCSAYGGYKGECNYKGEAFPVEPPTKSRCYKPRPTCGVACPICLSDGFYLGAAAGYDSYRVRQSVTAGTSTSDLVTQNPIVNPTGFVGGLFVGFGHYFNNFYLGGEVFGNSSNAIERYNDTATADGESVNYYSQITVRGSYGVGLLPGVKLNQSTLLYGRAGYNAASIRTKETVSADGEAITAKNSSYRSGFNYGLGIETGVYENFSVRTEYTHTNYSSMTSAFGTKFSPADNQFMGSIIYHIPV